MTTLHIDTLILFTIILKIDSLHVFPSKLLELKQHWGEKHGGRQFSKFWREQSMYLYIMWLWRMTPQPCAIYVHVNLMHWFCQNITNCLFSNENIRIPFFISWQHFFYKSMALLSLNLYFFLSQIYQRNCIKK